MSAQSGKTATNDEAETNPKERHFVYPPSYDTQAMLDRRSKSAGDVRMKLDDTVIHTVKLTFITPRGHATSYTLSSSAMLELRRAIDAALAEKEVA